MICVMWRCGYDYDGAFRFPLLVHLVHLVSLRSLTLFVHRLHLLSSLSVTYTFLFFHGFYFHCSSIFLLRFPLSLSPCWLDCF